MTTTNKSQILIILIALTLFLTNQILFSATLKFERFSNEQGFNQNTINAITQDRYGFLWFGTPNGLIKYDGYEFNTFTHDPIKGESISNNYIQCLYNDNNGVLWIGTREGVNIHLPRYEKFLKVPMGGLFDIIYISSDPKGRIWIAGEKELFVCDVSNSNEDVTFKLSENLLKGYSSRLNNINEFCFVDDNSILLSTSTGLLGIELDRTGKMPKIKSVNQIHSFSNGHITTVHKTNNIFWIGTYNGLYKATLEGNRMHVIRKFETIKGRTNPHSNLIIRSIFEDHSGSIWIGTSNDGIARYNQDEDEFDIFSYDPKNKFGISSPMINCLFQDNFDVLWIGTAQGGINKLDLLQKSFTNYAHNPYDKSSISGNLITGILEDRQGKLWITSYKESVCRSLNLVNNDDGSQLRFESLENQFPLDKQDVITCIFEDQKGYIWFGASSSLAVYNPNNRRMIKVPLVRKGRNVPLNRCRVIYQIDESRILLGGDQVIVIQNPWEQFKDKRELSIEIESFKYMGGKQVQTFLKDSRGKFWLGTNKGLLKCNFNQNIAMIEKQYTAQGHDSILLSNNNVFSLHEDYGGNIWIGTFGGGLNKLTLDQAGEPIEIEYFRKNDMLPDDAVYGILQEDDNHLWISTDMGLCRLNTSTKETDVFDVRDGLSNNNFRQAAFFKGKSGNFYFGGLNGLTIFKPEDVLMNNIPPKAVITALGVNNKSVQIGEEVNGEVLLEKSITETKNISFGHKEQIINFDLVVQHSATPAKNKLAYMLKGFSDEWIEKPVGKTTVTYTNLPPGDYVFKITGANGDDLWSTSSSDLNIKVLPPWYQSWWSYTIWFLLFIAIVSGVSMYYILHEKLKHRLEFEQLDKDRKDKMNQGKLRFFTNISHEFRTPLTLIAGPLERISANNNDPENEKYLSIIQNNTKRLLNLVDQLITFRQAEQGHINLNLSKNTLGNFIYPVTEAFEDYAIQKNINFFYKVNSPNENVVIDVEKTERIIFNLLSNSFKYTPDHGDISIETDIVEGANGNMVSIKVIDNGKGIPAENIERIFERFYQLEGREENVGGTGIGLAFCKSLVEFMGGNISVESEPNVRTCFSVLIPCDNIESDRLKKAIHPGKSFIKDWIPAPLSSSKDKSITQENKTEADFSILVVEDEAEVREFLKNALGKKYSVVLAENGVDAIDKLKGKEPDLVLSDVMMPEMDGFELCNQIKSEPATCHIPVILLTALGDHDNTIKGLEFGADDYISKPFSLRHLELRVEKLIENNVRLKEYFSKNSTIPEKDIDISNKDKEFLSHIIEAIEKNLSDSNYGVEELAKEIGLSTSQFYRRLKQLTGQIPNVYLRNYRLQRAAELLTSNEGYNVAEVMYQIGIESKSYFSTSFKKLHGVSPSEFLKRKS